MFKIYLSSVVVWMIIIWATISIFKDGIKKKVGSNETKKASLFKRLNGLFVLAAIPFVRLIVVIVLIYIATCKQEDYDELMKKANNN